MKKILLAMIILMGFLLISCSETKKEEDIDLCKDVTCSGLGTCETLNEEAHCICNSGYKNGENLTCIEETVNDPCKDITCGDNGSCQSIENQATCNCDTGFHAVGLNCVADNVTDPCEGITCGDNGVCEVVNNAPTCACDEGYYEDQLTCKEEVVDFDYKTIVGSSLDSETVVSVAVDSNDNRWIVGEFSKTLDLGCTNTLNSLNDMNAFVAKLDRTGKCLKLIQLDSTEVVEPSKIVVHNENVYVLASFMGKLTITGTELISRGEADIALIKMDINGNYLGSQTFGSIADDYGYGLFVESDNVYLSGSFQDELNFGSGISKTPNGGDDLFIVKLNNNLETTWVYTVGSSGDEVVNDLIVKDGFVYAVGEFTVSIDFNDTAEIEKRNPVGKDGFIIKLSDAGEFLWSRQIGGDLDDYLSKVVIDANNNLFVAGSFIDIIDANWSDEVGVEDIFIADEHHDIFITKLDTDGNYINTKQFVGVGDTAGHKGDDWVKDMIIKGDKLYIVGAFSDLLSFNPEDENDEAALRITEGGYDGFIVVLNNEVFESAFTFGSDLDDISNSVAIDSTNMIIMAGFWQNTAQFSPDSNNADEKTSAGQKDLFIWNSK